MALSHLRGGGKFSWKFVKQVLKQRPNASSAAERNGSCLQLELPLLSELCMFELILSKRHYRTCSHRRSPLFTAHDHTDGTCLARLGVGRMTLRLNSSSTPYDVVAKFTQDVDLEEVKEETRKQRMGSDKNVLVLDKIKETVAERCDEAIANLSEEDQKKLKVIQLEHNFLYSEGYSIPSAEEMTSQNWLEALGSTSKTQRLKYYYYIMKRKHIKEAELRKKAERRELMQDREKAETYEHGRLFMRIYESTMKKWLNYRLAAAMQFGAPIVFDMDYAQFMRPQEIKNTAKQLHDVYCVNRASEQMPFHLHFTSCPEDNPIYRLFQIQLQDSLDILVTATEQSYLNVFDRERLVYLSPNGKQVMRKYDPDAVYIVAAFNDKATQKPVSYARAKEQNIKCQRLPLDEHLNWTLGSKSMTLDQMIKIMIAVRDNKPWKEAFKAIPRRKVRDEHNADR